MTTNTSGMFRLNVQDFIRAAVVAVLAGVILPIEVIFQSPGFNIFAANWHQIGTIAITGAVGGFLSYLVKNFFSNSQGQVLGSIG